MKPYVPKQRAEVFDTYTQTLQGRLKEKGVPSKSLSISDALELQGQRLRYSPANTPLSVIRKHDEEDGRVPLFIGDLKEAWATLKDEAKIQGANWELHIIMLLSDQARNLIIGFTLHSPELKEMDWSADNRADFLKERDANMQLRSRQVWQHAWPLEEFDRVGKTISEANRSQILRVGDLPNIWNSVLKGSHEWGKVEGDPLIRISLDTHQGIACRGSNLDDPDYRDLILEWIGNSAEFCRANRHLYWNAKENAYTPKHQDEMPPPATPLQALLSEMTAV